MTQVSQRIEALLFLAGDAVSRKELARLAHCRLKDIDEALKELEEKFQGHGLGLVVTATHVQLATSASVAEFVRQYLEGEAQSLSVAALEALALIAYRGPIAITEMDALRGVDSRRVVRHLAERDLIRQVSEVWPKKYIVSEEFLRQLGVHRPEDLPRFQELSRNGRIEQVLSQPK